MVAQSDSLLYAAHSSILQVASELGVIGLMLFLAVMVAGTFLAAQEGHGSAVIGVAAWSALAVHSMIDHLYEFPSVVVLAGIVIGWAERGRDGSWCDQQPGQVPGRAPGCPGPGRGPPVDRAVHSATLAP
ncbi:hypothetical protein [Brachybacterium paraconglomeratum]|uniref:hypothetical protein n=1 Tax=Brachybacterium paraconglomeratum TaxID=173362 RepID=UPI0021A615ED|nr:hypothetical protein [Brachybacterium paraconglomeratum]MCT1908733.1 hypothetical protein [Brachybacterium paraconglomeratum]